MNYSEWLDTLDLANLNDLPPNEGMEMGWFTCKEEVLKIFHKYKIDDGHLISEQILKEIEKL